MSTPSESAPLLSLRAVAKVLGIDAGRLSKESKRPGFPARQTSSGTQFDPEEVRQWRHVNVRQRKKLLEAPTPAPVPADDQRSKPSAPSPPPAASPASARRQAAEDRIGEQDGELLAILESGKATALDISRAAMQIASRRVARAHRELVLGPNDLDGLKKSLQELRTAEADYISLEESKRQLIPREEVTAIVTECCFRLTRVIGVLENSISTEFALWLGDPKVAEMGADARARTIRQFVRGVTRSARIAEADDIDRLINNPPTE